MTADGVAFLDWVFQSPGAYAYLSVLVFAFGACWGSFLNVCIHRIPHEMSVVRPRSHCPHCGTLIAWHDNIPLVSWLALRGRCRHCAAGISPRYLLVETLVGILFLFAWLAYHPGGAARPLGLTPLVAPGLVGVYWLVIFGLVLGTFVDFEHMIIPDRVTKGGMVLGVLASLLVPALHLLPGEDTIGVPVALRRSLIGLLAGAGLLYGVGAVGKLIYRKDAMGFGDVKLVGALGAFFGWGSVLFILVGASLFGSIVGLSLVATGRKALQSRIPFGPYLALAALVWMFWGSAWWHAYVALLSGG